MNRDQRVALTFGLGGSLAVIAGIAVAIYVLVSRLGPALPDDLHTETPGAAERVDGPTAWRKQAEAGRRRQAATEAASAPLKSRYETTSLFGNIYETLYRRKDFDAVEKSLSERYALIGDARRAYQYSETIRFLGVLQHEFDPDQSRQIVKEWTEQRPDSHFAWLVRGNFEIHYAWYWRGDGYINTVTETGLERFREAMKLADGYLGRAIELDPNDPAALAFYMQTAMEGNRGDDEVERRFDRAIAAAPTFYYAYYIRLCDLMPKWGGSWELMDAFVEECDRLAAELRCPLLRRVRFDGYDEMMYNRPGYENIYQRPEVISDLISMTRAIMDAWPDDSGPRANYCHVLYQHGRFTDAYEQFELLGDRYVYPTRWPSLIHYNNCRAYATFRYADEKVRDGAKRTELFQRAVDLDARQGVFWYALAMESLKIGDLRATEAHFRSGIEKQPDSEHCWVGLAGVLAQAGRFEDVAKLVQDSKSHEFPAAARKRLDGLGQAAAAKGAAPGL